MPWLRPPVEIQLMLYSHSMCAPIHHQYCVMNSDVSRDTRYKYMGKGGRGWYHTNELLFVDFETKMIVTSCVQSAFKCSARTAVQVGGLAGMTLSPHLVYSAGWSVVLIFIVYQDTKNLQTRKFITRTIANTTDNEPTTIATRFRSEIIYTSSEK